jgi:hypothetical protein
MCGNICSLWLERYDNQHNNIQDNDTRDKRLICDLSIMILSIMTLSIMALRIMTFKIMTLDKGLICDTQYKGLVGQHKRHSA